MEEIQNKLVEEIPGVISIHEFHIWQLAGNKIIASAHVRCRTLGDYMAIANQLKEFFHNEGMLRLFKGSYILSYSVIWYK
jgi:zinc transporter 1